jgi:hypothetical protein
MLLVLTGARSTALGTWTFASAATLAILTTNWAFGLATAFLRLRFFDFVRVSAAAFAIIGSLAVVQNFVFPEAKLFFNPVLLLREYTNEVQFNNERDGFGKWSPVENIRANLIRGVVAPPPQLEEGKGRWGSYVWANNTYTPTSELTAQALAAVVCWCFILLAGLWGVKRDIARRPVSVALIAFALFQIVLYSVYGEIPFLYSANLVPVLMVVAAFSWFTPLRYFSVAAALALTVLGGPNNYEQFREAAAIVNDIGERAALPTVPEWMRIEQERSGSSGDRLGNPGSPADH